MHIYFTTRPHIFCGSITHYCVYPPLQGLLFSTPECLKSPLDFVRLWLHETSRVYGDKMIEDKDMENLRKLQLQTAKENFEVHDLLLRRVEQRVHMYVHVRGYVLSHRIWMMPH